MPKTKELEEKKSKKTETPEIDEDGEKEIDPEGILGESVLDENMDEDDISSLDDDEVDPFKDKWEE